MYRNKTDSKNLNEKKKRPKMQKKNLAAAIINQNGGAVESFQTDHVLNVHLDS